MGRTLPDIRLLQRSCHRSVMDERLHTSSELVFEGEGRRHDGGVGFPLTPDDVHEFREIVAAETGVQMDDQEAWNRATELCALYRMLLGPIPEDPDR